METTAEKSLERQAKYGGERRSMYLTNFAALGLLPTPTASDPKFEHTPPKYNGTLSQQIQAGLLPTPVARDWKGPEGNEYKRMRGEESQFQTQSLPGWAMSQNGKPSQLNPQFVAEMMGFPTNWTELPFQSGDTNH
jgi:hypothetical protein